MKNITKLQGEFFLPIPPTTQKNEKRHEREQIGHTRECVSLVIKRLWNSAEFKKGKKKLRYGILNMDLF